MRHAPVRHVKAVCPYPWAALDQLPREAVTLLPMFRRVLRRSVRESALASALGELTDSSVSIKARAIEVLTGPDLPSIHGASFVLANSDESVRIGVEIDRALAALLLAKLTKRPLRILDPMRALEPSVVGAVAAIVAAAARKAHGTETVLLPVGPGGLRVNPGERVLRVHATVLVDNEGFAAVVTLPSVLPHGAANTHSSVEHLSSLDDLPLTLPVIVATALMSRDELAALSQGDAWLPGLGWTIRREGESVVGEVTLGAETSERGWAGKLYEDGAIVLGEGRAIPLEIEAMQELESDIDMTTGKEAVLDAPIVVRVEMGAVTMTAREWANLAPGDVIALGKRVAEPISLRVAGVEVARGELVEIEGELGVRIHETRGER